MYTDYIESVVGQLRKYGKDEPTDLVLLVNSLEMIKTDIVNTKEYDEQLNKCID